MMNIPKIIGIHGKMQHGKDYAAGIIKSHLETKGFNVNIDKFGRPVREVVSIMLNIPYNDMHTIEDKNRIYMYRPSNSRAVVNYFKNKLLITNYINIYRAIDQFDVLFKKLGQMTLRSIFQYFATDYMRNLVDKNIWIDCLMKDLPLDKITIISDCRFNNEIESIKNHKGVLLKVVRCDSSYIKPSKNTHISETELDHSVYFDENNTIYNEMNDKFKTEIIKFIDSI